MARQTTDYTKAAAAVLNNMDSIHQSARRNSFKPGEVAQEIQNANAQRYKAFIRTAGELGENKIDNDSRLNQYKDTVKAKKEIDKIQQPAKFAGKLAALGRTGIGYAVYKQYQKEDKELFDAETKRLDEREKAITARQNLPKPKVEQSPELTKALEAVGIYTNEDGGWTVDKPVLPSSGSSAPVTPDTGTTLEQVGPDTSSAKPTPKLGPNSYDLSSLTDKDWADLAYITTGEAHPNSKDEFGVVANVLNRVKSDKFPNTISEVIHQVKPSIQYAAAHDGNAKANPELAARLRSPEGQKGIQEALEVLDGRLFFKGQSQLDNRVKDEDPMFHPLGNFYH